MQRASLFLSSVLYDTIDDRCSTASTLDRPSQTRPRFSECCRERAAIRRCVYVYVYVCVCEIVENCCKQEARHRKEGRKVHRCAMKSSKATLFWTSKDKSIRRKKRSCVVL